jgi:hypothetical protein
MMRLLAMLFGVSCLLFAAGEVPQTDEAPQTVQVTHTERVDFPAGGTLRLKNSMGELTIEGWDRPDVEITTIKSTALAVASRDRDKASHQLEKVRVSVAPQGSDLVITTEFPRHHFLFLKWGLWPASDLDLEYRIKVPMNAKVDVDQIAGEVHLENLTSDIRAVDHNGFISLLLPQDGQYDIDAKAKLGDVVSDFPGHGNRTHWFGHQFVQATKAAHQLYLRTSFGDIVIYKNR